MVQEARSGEPPGLIFFGLSLSGHRKQDSLFWLSRLSVMATDVPHPVSGPLAPTKRMEYDGPINELQGRVLIARAVGLIACVTPA